jgi:hypothetical protein
MVAKKTRERLELRQQIRELIQAGRIIKTLASSRAALRKTSPSQRTLVGEEQAVSVDAAPRPMLSVEERIVADKSGPPGEPGQTFDELFD